MDPITPLHDEFFLLGHDDYTGRSRINRDVLGTGLAGAVLAELVIAQRIAILPQDRVALLDHRKWNDPVTDSTARLIQEQRGPLPIRAWAEYLRGDLYALVGDHLADREVVEKVTTGLFRKTVHYKALDALAAAKPRVGLRHDAERLAAVNAAEATKPSAGLRYDTEGCVAGITQQSVALAALALATGLDSVVADPANRAARSGLEDLAAMAGHDVQRVVAGVKRAVTAMTLSVRGR